LNVNKACGPDGITSLLLKSVADFISIPLCRLFNKSVLSGILPSDWVSGNIVPIHKHNDKHNPGNYILTSNCVCMCVCVCLCGKIQVISPRGASWAVTFVTG